MNLDHIPVRLGEEGTRRWREEILGLYRGAQADRALEEEHLREDLERALDSKSIRAPLSRFLNGHGDEIRKWLCADGGEPNDKGSALATLCGQDTDALIALLGSLLPSRASAGLDRDDLRWINFRVAKLEQNRRALEFKQGLMLRDWLEQQRDGDVPVAISSSRASRWFYDAPTALEHELLELQHGHRPGVTITNRAATNEGLVVEVSPLNRETLLSWFTTLRELGKIDDIQLERLQEAFVDESVDLFYQLDASELLALMEAIMAGNITRMSPAATLKTLIVQRKQRATRNRSATFQAWATTSAKFFARWFRAHTHAGVKVNNEHLRALLELPPPSELSPGDLDDLIDALAREGARQQQAIGAILSRLPTHNLLAELKQGGAFVEDEKDPGWFTLSREWANIGALELIFELTPGDLSWLDVYWNHETIALAVRVSPPERLNDWVDAILDDPSRITSGPEVLEGLVSRADRARDLDDARLVRLWANLLWYSLSIDTSHFVHVFEKTSRLFEGRLPVLDAESPLATIASHTDDGVIARYLDKQQLVAAVAHKPEGERYLCRCVPFQLPFDFIKRVYTFESHLDFDLYEAMEGVPLLDLVRRLANKGNHDARNVLWRATRSHEHLTREELLEWILSLTFDEFHYIHVRALEDVLAWASGTQDKSRRAAYLSALRHVYKNLEELQRPGGFEDDVFDNFPTLWSLHGLELLGQLEPGFEVQTREGPFYTNDGTVLETITTEANPTANHLGAWLKPLLARGDEELDLNPIEKTMALARDLGLVDVLKRACFVHKQRLHLFFLSVDLELDYNGEVQRFRAAQLLGALHREALEALWSMGVREPLREFISANEPFQLTSFELARRRLIARIEWNVRFRGNKIPENISDDVWEAFVEWLFPSKKLSRYLGKRGAFMALKFFALDMEKAEQLTIPSPVLQFELDPNKRRDVIIETLGFSTEKISFHRMPVVFRDFLIQTFGLEAFAQSEAISLWCEPKEEHEARLFWARERDDAILERWCEACLDPENHEESWSKLREWARQGQPKRVERIWPHIKDDHRRELLHGLGGFDGGLNISEDSPLLEHLDLFERADEKIRFLRKHEVTGRRLACVVQEYLYVDDQHRIRRFLQLRNSEREAINHSYAEWHTDLERLNETMKAFLETGQSEEDGVYPYYLEGSTHVWCIDTIVRRYPALLEAYIKHTVVRLCGLLSGENFNHHWAEEPGSFLYDEVELHIQPQMKRIKLAPSSFDRGALTARILETIDSCPNRTSIPMGVLSLSREEVPSILLTELTGTWSRPEKIHEWNRTDIDDDTSLEVALTRFSRRFYEREGEPVRHQDELEMLDFIENALEHQPNSEPYTFDNIEEILRSLRYADAIERVGPIRQRMEARLKKI